MQTSQDWDVSDEPFLLITQVQDKKDSTESACHNVEHRTFSMILLVKTGFLKSEASLGESKGAGSVILTCVLYFLIMKIFSPNFIRCFLIVTLDF